ncbi:MAG: diaminopimelate epimerase [Acidimicrobiales bacterium]
MAALRLNKHHGAGNDFLVLLDAEGTRPVTAAEVRALCDRRLGIGADGLIRATRGSGGADVAMELRNADGGEAEMSGNGIRCLVQAAVEAGWVAPGDVTVDTAAGRRTVRYRVEPQAGQGHATVLMGAPVLGEELSLPEPAGLRAARAADMGNPHIVLLLDGPPSDDVVAEAGPRLGASVPSGANVEFVWEGPGDDLTMRVWERGVGETLACGTGTCAVAAVARAWRLRGDVVVVHNPGGPLRVTLRDGEAVLGGPTMSVGVVTIDEATLATLAVAHGEVAAAR